jgi:hypothetical protein
MTECTTHHKNIWQEYVINNERRKFALHVSACNSVITSIVFFLWHLDPTPGHGLPFWGFVITFIEHNTLGRGSLDEWSARHRNLYPTTHNTHKRQTSMPPAGFEPTVPTSEWSHTQALDCLATWISNLTNSTTRDLQKSMSLTLWHQNFLLNCE